MTVPQCATGTCQPIPGAGTQGDAFPPGQCKLSNGSAGTLTKTPVLCFPSGTSCLANATDGVANASGNYLLSANLFRFRDTLRQDIIDNSGLILALARPPPPTLPATTNPNLVAAELQSKGIIVDPAHVFWEGQSLGGILGTINVAVLKFTTDAAAGVERGAGYSGLHHLGFEVDDLTLLDLRRSSDRRIVGEGRAVHRADQAIPDRLRLHRASPRGVRRADVLEPRGEAGAGVL